MIESIPNFNQAELESVILWNRILVYATMYGQAKKVSQVLQNHQIPLPYEDWDTVLWLTTSPNTFLDGSTLMNYADDSYSVSSFSINSSDGSGGFDGGGFSDGGGGGGFWCLLIAVKRRLESTDFGLSFCFQRRIIVEKSAYFRYNRTDREIEERSDVEMNL